MRRPNGTDGVHLRTWPSMTDVALCLALVMVLYVVAQFAVGYVTTALALEVQSREQQLREELEGLQKDLHLLEDGNLQRITFADQVLFESGKAELIASGQVVLAEVGAVLKRRSKMFERLQVEGHTDDQKLSTDSPFASNWQLSSARATSVVLFLEQVCGLEPGLLSATGYGEFQPVDLSSTEEARRRNRRVELVIVYSTRSILAELNGGGRNGGGPDTPSTTTEVEDHGSRE